MGVFLGVGLKFVGVVFKTGREPIRSWMVRETVVSSAHQGVQVLVLALLEKRLLVAHLFLLLMAHYRCATINTPLVTNSNGAPLVRH